MNGRAAPFEVVAGRAEPMAAVGRARQAGALTRGVTVVRTREGLDALAPAWQALESEARGAVFFQSLAWCRAVFDFEAARGNARFEPVIATLAEGGRLKAVLPLERVRTLARRVLVPLGHSFAQYSDLITAVDVDPAAAVMALIAAAVAALPADSANFLKVRSGSTLAAGMPPENIVTGTAQGAPYVALSDFPDFPAYFQTIKSKTRKNMRNARNRLEREGPVSHRVAESDEDILSLIERTHAGRADRLKDQGLTSRAFADEGFVDFCRRLPGAGGIDILAMSLTHNGHPIAEQWGFVHNRRYYAFVASRDFSNSEESPGKLHLGEVIRACADRGLEGADLMVPVMPYKLTWATEVVEVTDHALALTWRGRLITRFWDQFTRPLLKQAVLTSPPWLRASLMRVLGRA
jgi:CelD/BcsL family acetyltransferase involved in cellulose biosynthesis